MTLGEVRLRLGLKEWTQFVVVGDRDGMILNTIAPPAMAEFAEYQCVGQVLSSRYGGADFEPILALLTVEAEFIAAPALPAPIAVDPNDDKFFACASAAGVAVFVSREETISIASQAAARCASARA